MVHTLPSGELEFKVFAPEATAVEVVGSFTGWGATPLMLDRDETGWWTTTAQLQPGDHEFLYRIDGWRDQADYAAHGVRLNPWGQWVSRLTVAKVRRMAG